MYLEPCLGLHLSTGPEGLDVSWRQGWYMVLDLLCHNAISSFLRTDTERDLPSASSLAKCLGLASLKLGSFSGPLVQVQGRVVSRYWQEQLGHALAAVRRL